MNKIIKTAIASMIFCMALIFGFVSIFMTMAHFFCGHLMTSIMYAIVGSVCAGITTAIYIYVANNA